MTLSTTTKIIGTTVLAAGVTAGALLWNGGATIDQAINTLDNNQTSLVQFKENETKLVNHITTLKDKVTSLEGQLAIAPTEEEVNALIEEIEALKLQIRDLEEAEGDYTVHLETELNKANEDTERLQQKLDELQDVQPMTDEEIDELIGSESVVEPEEEIEDPYNLTYKQHSSSFEIIPGIILTTESNGGYKLSNSSGKEVQYNFQPGGSMSGLYSGSYKIMPGTTKSITLISNKQTYTITLIK